MIDPNAFLFVIAILFGGIALFIVLLVYLSSKAFSTQGEEYIAKLYGRIVSMIIDIAILRLVIDLVLAILNPGYISLFFLAGTIFSLNPIASLFSVVLAIIESISNYLFFYIAIFLGINISITSLLVAIFGFLYFFVFDSFFEGRTLGRRVLRLKTLHESKDRTLSFGEAAVNAIGKAFILMDLIFGFLVSLMDSRNPGLRQVRLTQKLARAVTIDPSVRIPSDGNNSQSFLRDDDKSGVLW
ncbi:MAG: hypothetical protein ACTSW7_00310 [Candidatus Thorarchaeota archaeon]